MAVWDFFFLSTLDTLNKIHLEIDNEIKFILLFFKKTVIQQASINTQYSE